MRSIGKNAIFQQIAESKFPCWNLYNLNMYRKVLVRAYNCEDMPEDADNDIKVENAIKALTITLSSYPSDAKFAIEIKASKNANGQSFYGPIEFENRDIDTATAEREPQREREPQPQRMAANVLSGLPNLGELEKYGLATKSEFDARLEIERLKNAQQLNDLQLKIDRQLMQAEFDRKNEMLQAERARLDETRREVTSGINKAVEVVKLAGPYLLGPLLGVPMEKIRELQGTMTEDPQPTEPADKRRSAIEDLATDLFESSFSEDQIRQIRQNINTLMSHQDATIHKIETAAAEQADGGDE